MATPKKRVPGAQNPITMKRVEREIKVRALKTGFTLNHERVREGDVFTIPGDRFPKGHAKAGELIYFSTKWMEMVDAKTPLQQTTGQEILDRQVEEHRMRLAGATHEPRANDDDVTTRKRR